MADAIWASPVWWLVGKKSHRESQELKVVLLISWGRVTTMEDAPSRFQENLVLSVCPDGSQILEAWYVRDFLRPCPMHIPVALPTGDVRTLILKLDRFAGGVETESKLLPGLLRHGLTVAEILAGPARDPAHPELGAMCVLSLLPGEDLLTWGHRVHAAERNIIGQLALQAVAWLQRLTGPVCEELNGAELPRRTLSFELQAIIDKGGPWFDERDFREAVDQLKALVTRVRTPLVFSNGDFNPANFLSDGHMLTGFVDFGGACLEDPGFGVAKYATYEWLPFEGEAMMRHWVAKHGLSEYNRELRIALACLWTLRQLPVSPVTERPYNQGRIRRRLCEACAKLR